MLRRARKNPPHNSICFHAQQCAEKYCKARLVEADIPFRKTHDLIEVLSQALVIEPDWVSIQEQMDFLNNFSGLYRYPGASATKEEAKRAAKDCRTVRKCIRAAFGLPA